MNKTIKSIFLSAIVLTQVATPVMANSVQESVYASVKDNVWAIGGNLKNMATNTAQVATKTLIGWMPSVLKQLTDETRKITEALTTCPTATLALTGVATYTAYKFFFKNSTRKKRWKKQFSGIVSGFRQPAENEEYSDEEE